MPTACMPTLQKWQGAPNGIGAQLNTRKTQNALTTIMIALLNSMTGTTFLRSINHDGKPAELVRVLAINNDPSKKATGDNVNNEAFLNIIDTTPLVSIDIILKDSDGRVLLGKRNNKPAKDFWFVPGGRIRKNETLNQALARISQVELGFQLSIEQTSLIGAFDHIYPDNAFDRKGINTHYVALGHEATLQAGQEICIDSQHSAVAWWSVADLLESTEVHENTKAYFLS